MLLAKAIRRPVGIAERLQVADGQGHGRPVVAGDELDLRDVSLPSSDR
jgi:hypothetical protein